MIYPVDSAIVSAGYSAIHRLNQPRPEFENQALRILLLGVQILFHTKVGLGS